MSSTIRDAPTRQDWLEFARTTTPISRRGSKPMKVRKPAVHRCARRWRCLPRTGRSSSARSTSVRLRRATSRLGRLRDTHRLFEGRRRFADVGIEEM